MEALREKPIFTDELEVSEFAIGTDAAYIYELSEEDRSKHVLTLRTRSPDANYIEIHQKDPYTVATTVATHEALSMRRRSEVERFISGISQRVIIIDITGMTHNAWAPLVRVALELGREVRAVYVEPRSYSYSKSPRQGDIFDLSERISGIGPIPLFADLSDRAEQQTCFIPILGFEGTRFSYMLEQVQAPDRRIFPVIGVPGFRPEYPFHAYLGNSAPLDRTKSFRNVRFAKSNCPFSLYYVVESIMERAPDDHVKIGLIGTKPHALGAILLAISSHRPVELVYDQVIRKRDRTEGFAKCLVYAISDFLPDFSVRRARSNG